jgi:hypothetical protein
MSVPNHSSVGPLSTIAIARPIICVPPSRRARALRVKSHAQRISKSSAASARLLTAAPKALCVAARCWQRRPRFNPSLLAPAILETVVFLAQAHQSDVRVKGPHFQGSLPIRPAQISTRGAPCCLRRQEMRWGSPAELMLDPASGRFPVPFPPLSPLYLTRAVPLLIPASFAAFTHSRPNCHLRPVTHSHLTISLSHDATTPTAQQQQHPLRTQTCVTLPPWC